MEVSLICESSMPISAVILSKDDGQSLLRKIFSAYVKLDVESHRLMNPCARESSSGDPGGELADVEWLKVGNVADGCQYPLHNPFRMA